MNPRLAGLLLATCLFLSACETAVDVVATSPVPARYASVLVTVQEVWFNESATAVSGDDTWLKFPLDDSLTIDLVDLTGGTLTLLAGELEVPEGTYRQIRLLLADRHASLEDSADDMGATYNNEVIYFDEDGDRQTLPLELPGVEQGIGIAMSLDVVQDTQAVALALGGSGASAGSTVDATAVVVFDAQRDLTEFRYGGDTGFLLNATLAAFDSAEVGTIRGSVSLTQLTIDTGTGRPDIQVTAQQRDGDRRVVVARAFVSRTGSFVLYPLPFDEDADDNEYDLVISGPGIQTVVVREVPVTDAPPANAAAVSWGVITLNPATSFAADVSEASPLSQRGASVGFYQTLPDDQEPYLVAMATVDPLNGRLSQEVSLSRSSSIQYGTYGTGFNLRPETPQEGAARFRVAALSSHYGKGDFADTTLRAAGSASDTAMFTVPAIALPAATVSGTLSTDITVGLPGRYDRGALVISHEGAVVATTSLDALLATSGSGFVEVTNLPAGSAAAAHAAGSYHVEAWTWNAADPEDSFTRHAGAALVDLRASAAGSGAVTLD